MPRKAMRSTGSGGHIHISLHTFQYLRNPHPKSPLCKQNTYALMARCYRPNKLSHKGHGMTSLAKSCKEILHSLGPGSLLVKKGGTHFGGNKQQMVPTPVKGHPSKDTHRLARTQCVTPKGDIDRASLGACHVNRW